MRGLRAALGSPRTPRQLRAGLRDYLRHLEGGGPLRRRGRSERAAEKVYPPDTLEQCRRVCGQASNAAPAGSPRAPGTQAKGVR